jgi:hypothetical protein
MVQVAFGASEGMLVPKQTLNPNTQSHPPKTTQTNFIT